MLIKYLVLIFPYSCNERLKMVQMTRNSAETSSNMKKKKKAAAKEVEMAIILFLIVLIFLVCHTPKNIVNIYEGIITIGNMTNTDTSQPSKIFIPILVAFSHALLTINSSINILIYLTKVTTNNLFIFFYFTFGFLSG